MTNSRHIKLPPFTLVYIGFNRFLVNKGFVFQANNGRKIDVTYNGELLTDAWTGEDVIINLEDGQTVSLKVTHADKSDHRKYEIVDLESAEIVIADPEDINSETVTAIKIADVTIDNPVSSPTINQILNSDAYLAVFGTEAVF